MSAPWWRVAFDLVERPLAAASESWLQSEPFMDVAAIGFKVQRRLSAETQRTFETCLGVVGLPTRSDVNALVNQVAGLERQLRELAARDEQRNGDRPAPRARRASG
jgi:hypothetical protein